MNFLVDAEVVQLSSHPGGHYSETPVPIGEGARKAEREHNTLSPKDQS
jgi:hypothetical protein